jgi:hypothetical protein
MALFKSHIATQISGSVGGTTFAHNAGGMYMRARTVPVNPQTSFQNQARNALTTLVNAWTETLTALQRAAWDLYASNVTVTNPLGDNITNSGQNWYIAVNQPRLMCDAKLGTTLGRIDNAPTIFDRSLLTTPAVPVLDVSSNNLTFTFTNTNTWATAVGGALLVFQGRPVNGGRTYFRGPWRLIGRVLGAVVPPTSPGTITTVSTQGFPFVVGQTCYIAFAAVTADGRLTTRQILLANIQA